jgi:hypothetical protein
MEWIMRECREVYQRFVVRVEQANASHQVFILDRELQGSLREYGVISALMSC